jgi:hypothetical protein
MISVSVRTRSACSSATACAMNPPIDASTRLTSPSPRPSMSPATSAGHVADRVRRRPAPHENVSQARRRQIPQVGRSAHIPVVEPDDEKTAPGQTCAQLVRPGDHLRRQAHDQHDRRRARVPERLIRQLDVIRGNPAQRASSDITNGRSLACDKPPATSAVRQLASPRPASAHEIEVMARPASPAAATFT